MIAGFLESYLLRLVLIVGGFARGVAILKPSSWILIDHDFVGDLAGCIKDRKPKRTVPKCRPPPQHVCMQLFFDSKWCLPRTTPFPGTSFPTPKPKAQREQINQRVIELVTPTPSQTIPDEIQLLDLTKSNVELMTSLWESHVGNPPCYSKKSCQSEGTSLDKLKYKNHANGPKPTKINTARPLMVRWP